MLHRKCWLNVSCTPVCPGQPPWYTHKPLLCCNPHIYVPRPGTSPAPPIANVHLRIRNVLLDTMCGKTNSVFPEPVSPRAFSAYTNSYCIFPGAPGPILGVTLDCSASHPTSSPHRKSTGSAFKIHPGPDLRLCTGYTGLLAFA